MTEFSFDLEAVSELAEATAWYEARRPGLGSDFLDEVERLISVIQTRPSSFPRLLDPATKFEVRRALVARFPYALVFLVTETDVRIVAAAHHRRESSYWLNRIEP